MNVEDMTMADTLRLVKMAMAEDGFPTVEVFIEGSPDDRLLQAGPGGPNLSIWDDEPERAQRSFYRACGLVSRMFTHKPQPLCEECFVTDAKPCAHPRPALIEGSAA